MRGSVFILRQHHHLSTCIIFLTTNTPVLDGPFLKEAIIRNARWVLEASPELDFSASEASLWLTMVQITLLSSYASDLARLDNDYGFSEKSFSERMVGGQSDMQGRYVAGVLPAGPVCAWDFL